MESISEEQQSLAMQMIVCASDVSNASKPLEIYEQWAHMCMSEFFLQGDRERELALPIGALNDRHKISFPKSQVGFIKFVVQPMQEVWAGFLFSSKDNVVLQNTNDNLAE